jgi:hypothetical protein
MTHRQQNAFVAALMLGGSLGLVRVASARTTGDLLLAVALTGAEFGAAAFLNKKAKDLQAEIDAVNAQEEKFGQAEASARTASEELARRQNLLDQTEQAIVKIDEKFELDHELGDLKSLTTIATNAVRGGYYAGVSENDGFLGGVPNGKEPK